MVKKETGGFYDEHYVIQRNLPRRMTFSYGTIGILEKVV